MMRKIGHTPLGVSSSGVTICRRLVTGIKASPVKVSSEGDDSVDCRFPPSILDASVLDFDCAAAAEDSPLIARSRFESFVVVVEDPFNVFNG